MATTIHTTLTGYSLHDPRTLRVIRVATLLQAVTYCRETRLQYTIAI